MLKAQLLELLKTDEEFRLAVRGLIGLDEILNRMDKLESRIEQYSETIKELTKTVKEQGETIKEHSRILKQYSETIKEHSKVIGDLVSKIEDLSRVVGELKVVTGSLGRRWGRDLEKTVYNIYKNLLEERGIEPGKVEKFTYIDYDGKFYSKGARIELDFYIKDEKTYFLEVKSHASLRDVEWFKQVAKISERIMNRKAEKLFLIAVNLDVEAYNRAKELGIETIYGSLIE